MPNIAIIKHWMDKAEALEKELAEKDAMIDWLANHLVETMKQDCIPACDIGKLMTSQDFIRMAKKQVKKGD